MISNPTARKVSLTVIALISWFALLLQLWLMLKNNPALGITAVESVSNFLSYFTILSNILVALCTSFLLFPGSSIGNFFSRDNTQSAIALYIFIVGLVYNLVLRGIWEPKGWQLLADNLLHVLVPLLFISYWFLFVTRKSLKWKNLFPWLIFPLIYLIYSLIRGSVTGWYPYPFLDAGKHGYDAVALNSLFVLLAFLLTAVGIIAINRTGSLKEPKA